MRIQSKPIAIKERHSILFLQYGQLDVKDGSFVLIDKVGVRTHIPIGSIACLMLEPGTRVSHASVALAAGYAPAIGFIHTGKPQSFVYDIADLFKFETVVPMAFKVASENPEDPARTTRHYCRNSFREHQVLRKLIPTIEDVLSAGGIDRPKAHKEAIEIAIPNEKGVGDVGHRN